MAAIANNLGGRWVRSLLKFCVRERGGLGDEMLTLSAILVDDVAVRATRGKAGLSQTGGLPSRTPRTGAEAIVHRCCFPASRAYCAELLWLRCGLTTYAVGRPLHRGSGLALKDGAEPSLGAPGPE